MYRLKTFPAVFTKGIIDAEPSKQLLDLCRDNKEPNPVEKLQSLRRRGADPNFKENDVDKKNKQKSPIHYAAKNGNTSILHFLLNWNNEDNQKDEVSVSLEDSPSMPVKHIDINQVDNKGRTAFHYAAKTCCNRAECEEFIQCVYLLMNTPGVSLNLPDKEGYTPITYAVLRRHKDRLQAMISHERRSSLNLDISPADGELSARKAIRKFYPETSENLAHRPDEADSSVGKQGDRLLRALIDNNLSGFQSELYQHPINPEYGEPYYASCIEVACTMEKRSDFVKAMLQIGISPNTCNSIYMKPLLHLAVEQGKVEVLDALLDCKQTDVNVVDNYKRNVLQYAAKQQCIGPGGINRIQSCIAKILSGHLRYLDTRPKFDINARDSDGNTALHLASRYGHEETVLTLLRSDANLLVKNNDNEYALTSIDVDILRTFLDEQVESTNNSVEDKKFHIEFHYGFLKSNEDTGMTALLLLSQRSHLRELLKHPVICSFLDMRWKRVRTYFMLNILFYALFVILLTAQVLIIDDKAEEGDPNTGAFQDAVLDASSTIWIILLGLLIILIGREIVQVVVHPLKYISGPENYLEWTLFICVILTVFTDAIPPAAKSHLAPIIILMSWSELIIMTGRLPILSVQLEMSKKVTLTFLQYMPWYTLAVAAFALSFYSMFRNVEEADENMFIYPMSGVFKTVLMMTGEYDMSSPLFEATPITSHLVFLLFVFMVAIVMLNLLSGLAVGDTSSIRDKADVLSLVHRVKLVVFMEQSLKFFMERFGKARFPDQIWVYPNEGRIAYTDINTRFYVDKSVVEEALEIVANKKKTKNRTRWNGLLRGRRQPQDENLTKTLEALNKRLEAMEKSLKQLIVAKEGFTSKPRVKHEGT